MGAGPFRGNLVQRINAYLGYALVFSMLAGCAAEAPLPAVEVLDLEGRPFDPLHEGQAAVRVLFFVRADCPISNRYAPEVARLVERFAPQGVAFWTVYPDPDETAESIREHLASYAYPSAALRDVEHRLVELTGAEVTPEAAVFVAGQGLVYRGRIDDRYVTFGRSRQQPMRHDLEEVLEAALDGRALQARTAPAVGCAIRQLL